MKNLTELNTKELEIINGGSCSFAYDVGFFLRLSIFGRDPVSFAIEQTQYIINCE